MEIKERNTIIGVVSFIVDLILIISLIPTFTSLFVNPLNILYMFIYPYGYIILDLFVLLFTLFLYGCFMIKPMNTLSGKKNLATGTLILGGILVVLPIIGMVYTSFILFGYSFYYILSLIPYLVLLIPGVALFMHGWFLIHKPRIDNME